MMFAYDDNDHVTVDDCVRWKQSNVAWYVDEVDGECAWISDGHGREEWVRVTDLERVVEL